MTNRKYRPRFYRKRPAWTMSNAAAFTMRDKSIRCCNNPTVLLSLPSYNAMVGNTDGLNNTRFERIMIKLKNEHDYKDTKTVKQALRDSFTEDQRYLFRFYDFLYDQEDIEQIETVLSTIFDIIIAITMFLCFFSLCSSMTANLMDQTKEIGILRAMGFTKFRIKMLYFYEAFVLVLASSLLGCMIGTIVGFTIIVQRQVFSDLPVTFFFPWNQFRTIMIVSIFCAFGSTWAPTGRLVKRDIASIFRIV